MFALQWASAKTSQLFANLVRLSAERRWQISLLFQGRCEARKEHVIGHKVAIHYDQTATTPSKPPVLVRIVQQLTGGEEGSVARRKR